MEYKGADMRLLAVRDLGTVAYGEAYALQRKAVKRVQERTGGETLYLLEHPHVITKGRNATNDSVIVSSQLLTSRGVTLVETDRGGDVTYHGPGQLVGYPILKLEDGRRDIRRFVHDLEEVLIRTVGEFGIVGSRHPEHRGVWVEGRKLASVGIRIARWVTSHGFALNVSTDLSYFSLIHPCGIQGCEMTSIAKETGQSPDMAVVKELFVGHFCDVYGRRIDGDDGVEEARRYG